MAISIMGWISGLVILALLIYGFGTQANIAGNAGNFAGVAAPIGTYSDMQGIYNMELQVSRASVYANLVYAPGTDREVPLVLFGEAEDRPSRLPDCGSWEVVSADGYLRIAGYFTNPNAMEKYTAIITGAELACEGENAYFIMEYDSQYGWQYDHQAIVEEGTITLQRAGYIAIEPEPLREQPIAPVSYEQPEVEYAPPPQLSPGPVAQKPMNVFDAIVSWISNLLRSLFGG